MVRQYSETTRVDTGSHDRIHIALISAYPPTKGNLAEYTAHLTDAYRRQDNVTIDVLATRAPNAPNRENHRDLNVYRLWEPDAPVSAVRILRKIREKAYDAVHFNIRMGYFGSGNLARLIGLFLPSVVRLGMRVPVVVTLHDFLEIVDEAALPESIGFLERFGASLGTQFVLLSNVTTVTHPKYKEVIEEKYRVHNVEHVPHGTFTSNRTRRTQRNPFRILLFGHLSPTKDYTTVFEAFEKLKSDRSDIELCIAGDSHPDHPDMRARLEQRYGSWEGVCFLGYVPEHEVENVFESSSVLVLPYYTCPGVSGVYHLAKTFAMPTIAYDTEEMHESTVTTGGVVEFVEPESPRSLASTLADLEANPERLESLAERMNHADAGPTLDDTANRLARIMRGLADD